MSDGSRQDASGLLNRSSWYEALRSQIYALTDQMATATLVQIKAVHAGTGVAAGTVDVMPMVHQVDGQGNVTPHGVIYGVPYLRMQGGAAAVIIDPVVGDIGIALFASRDVSAVKASRASAQPGSRRRYSMSDALYLGGMLNGEPQHFVQITASGVTVTSSAAVTINAPTTTINGDLAVTGEITARQGGASVTLSQHRHPNNGQPPTPGT